MAVHQQNLLDNAPAPPWMRQGARWLFLCTLVFLALVYQPHTGWNVNTRLALVFAIIDHGTFRIDDYHATPQLETGDKALFEGHYYSDKVFGVSLLGLPVYAWMRILGDLYGFDWPFQAKNHLVRLGAVSMPAAYSVALLWMLMVRLGAAPRRALFAVAAAFAGSMWMGYATIFMPYVPGIAACLGALYLLLYPTGNRLTPGNSFAIGLLCGFAVICDFIFGLMVAGLSAIYLYRLAFQCGWLKSEAFPGPRGADSTPLEALRIWGLGILGGVLPLALFAVYSASIFGSPTIPYEYEADPMFREAMQRGFMGIQTPNPTVAWYLTFHPYRGLFFWSPWLVLAIAGCVMSLRQPTKSRLAGSLGLWAFAAYLVFNSGYYMWWGGWAMGPRLMLPMMAAIPIGLAELIRPGRPRVWWWTLLVAGIASLLLNVPIALMDPQLPQGNQHPVLENITFSTNLAVPQFVYLKAFYSLRWFWPPGEGGIVWSRLAPIAAACAGGWILSRIGTASTDNSE